VAGALASHVAPREAPEFVIDDEGQPVERGSISSLQARSNPPTSPISGACAALFTACSEFPIAPHKGHHTLPSQPFKDKEISG
jgi:hypothetical protein